VLDETRALVGGRRITVVFDRDGKAKALPRAPAASGHAPGW